MRERAQIMTMNCFLWSEGVNNFFDCRMIAAANYSIPWANIITIPGSMIMSSLMCALSQAMTMTACLPGTRRQTYCSYCRLFICRVSRVKSPGGHRRSCALSIRSSKTVSGHPDSAKQRRIWACSSEFGVEIMPPHRVTLARVKFWHQPTMASASCILDVKVRTRMSGSEASTVTCPLSVVETRSLSRLEEAAAASIPALLRTRSLSMDISLLCSANWYLQSLTVCSNSEIFSSCVRIMDLSSRTQLWSFISSFGTVRPQPLSQETGFLGLWMHSFRWWGSRSNLVMTSQPWLALSQLISSLPKRFFKILGTGCNWLTVNSCRSTGQVFARDIHCLIHPTQNACSHTGACMGDSRTPEQIGHSSSSSTWPPRNLFTSNPILEISSKKPKLGQVCCNLWSTGRFC